MNTLTAPLQAHHKHCDELFSAAEASVDQGDWLRAAAETSAFARELEAHFGVEETTLFPAFETHTGMTMGPTQMMRMEHAQMRELVAQMQAALTSRDARTFAGAAETLLIMMQQHNMKEENILYPMIDRSLATEVDTLGGHISQMLRSACQPA